tara:strand:- start:444 stop:3110 length:2667 start_codon:yes stop_codon:yes gene_type:complete
MSVQLIVFPQYYDGSTPLSSTSSQFFVDGINFSQVNASSSVLNISGALPQAFINSYTLGGYTFFIVNTWYRFSSGGTYVAQGANTILVAPTTGILQRLSNLTFGATYDLTLNIDVNSTTFTVYQYDNDILRSTHTITGTGTQTIQFDAYSTADTIVIHSATSVVIILDISCVLSTSTPSGVFTDLSNGQVICDLYEDEDIPLSLSVDDFKNVAEKVQSYSKAFNLPATKRNNQIFDNIFEVTRTDTGLNFNPYKKTKCILKQDGFLLFEGYLRLIDISDKEGEISYNVNLYSEVVALADVLGERTFNDISFDELEHSYDYTEIRNSWQGILGLTNPLPVGSFAGTAGTSVTEVLRYPFCDWTHQYTFDASSGFPVLPTLESAFRPFINIKYLIDRIFEATDFTYESAFFDTADFGNLFMDFNWGGDNIPTAQNETYLARWYFNVSPSIPSNIGNNSFKEFHLIPETISPSQAPSELPPNYDAATNTITATTDNEIYDITYTFLFGKTSATSEIIECQWLHNSTPINQQTVFFPAPNTVRSYTGTFQISLQTGDTLSAQFKGDTDIRQNETFPSSCVFVQSSSTISSSTLQVLRGELGQWDFLKGIMTMFNLVSLPDENNPSNIKIEPYADIFINNAESTELDWTDKIDVSEMKLTPLTDLNKSTIFKFVEDDDDYAFTNYKNSVGGHLYGSKKYDASEFTILAGEDEIVAEPFAATLVKPLDEQFSDLIIPAVYSYNPEDRTSEGFENSPRIMYKNGVKTLSSCTYFVPDQNGVSGDAFEDEFLQFSHLSTIPTASGTLDFHFGQCQLISPVGASVPDNLFNLYWLPYYSELYNPDTRTMTIKVNLSPSDINTFKFYDTIFIKNRTFRVNKIDYKPNDLATVEFILLP